MDSNTSPASPGPETQTSLTLIQQLILPSVISLGITYLTWSFNYSIFIHPQQRAVLNVEEKSNIHSDQLVEAGLERTEKLHEAFEHERSLRIILVNRAFIILRSEPTSSQKQMALRFLDVDAARREFMAAFDGNLIIQDHLKALKRQLDAEDNLFRLIVTEDHLSRSEIKGVRKMQVSARESSIQADAAWSRLGEMKCRYKQTSQFRDKLVNARIAEAERPGIVVIIVEVFFLLCALALGCILLSEGIRKKLA